VTSVHSGHAYQPRRAPRIETITLRGLSHQLTRWGPPQAEPMILLHGFMDTAATWQFLVDEMPVDSALAALDWRGFGGSQWAPGGYWFPDYLGDLDALLDALVPGARARVIGHSLGGNVVSVYAGLRQDRLAWVANLEGVGLPPTSAADAPAHYARWLDELRKPERETSYASIEDLAAKLTLRNPRLAADRALFIARAWTRRRSDGLYYLAADPKHRWSNPYRYRRDDAEACWRRVRVPVALFLGEHSDLLRRFGAGATAETFRGMFDDVELVTIPGAGHMMHHENPAAVAGAIIAFAAKHDDSRRTRQ
jgi:pimeloyl-ACP methyl ester carboxylesterase